MQSLRRAAVRSAVSVSRAAASKPQVTSFALQFAFGQTAPKAVSLPIARFFSQAARFQDESAVGAPASPGVTTPDEHPYGIFIRNVIFDATEEHLREAFAQYGDVLETAIPRDQRGLPRGYAFVYFATQEQRDAAVTGADGTFWHGRRLMVAERQKGTRSNNNSSSNRRAGGRADGPTTSLYIGNIPYETTDTELNRMFKELDGVTDIRVAVDRNTGWPRGFAHADFEDIEHAQKAANDLAEITLSGRKLRIDFATPKPKEDRVGQSDGADGADA